MYTRVSLFVLHWQCSCLLQPVVVSLSARSSSEGVQATLESKMVAVRKNLLGAPEGKTAVIFVDDVNLPARDAFDSQAPLELLRQLVSALPCINATHRLRPKAKMLRKTTAAVASDCSILYKQDMCGHEIQG